MRDRIFQPFPHEFEQFAHDIQLDQPPLTDTGGGKEDNIK